MSFRPRLSERMCLSMLAPGWLGSRASTDKLNPLCVFYALVMAHLGADGLGPLASIIIIRYSGRDRNVSVGIVVIHPTLPLYSTCLDGTAKHTIKPKTRRQIPNPVKEASKLEMGKEEEGKKKKKKKGP